jgi:hypothetical protein
LSFEAFSFYYGWRLVRFLVPAVLPSLRYFAIESFDEHDYGSDLRRSSFRHLVPQLDSAKMDLCVWEALKDDCLASKASSILVDWTLDRRLEDHSLLGGIQHLRLGALYPRSPFEDPVRDNLKLLEREINSSKQLELRTLFWRATNTPDQTTAIRRSALKRCARSCARVIRKAFA